MALSARWISSTGPYDALEHSRLRFVPLLALALLGAGCAGTLVYTRVYVPVPVARTEPVPDRTG